MVPVPLLLAWVHAEARSSSLCTTGTVLALPCMALGLCGAGQAGAGGCRAKKWHAHTRARVRGCLQSIIVLCWQAPCIWPAAMAMAIHTGRGIGRERFDLPIGRVRFDLPTQVPTYVYARAVLALCKQHLGHTCSYSYKHICACALPAPAARPTAHCTSSQPRKEPMGWAPQRGAKAKIPQKWSCISNITASVFISALAGIGSIQHAHQYHSGIMFKKVRMSKTSQGGCGWVFHMYRSPIGRRRELLIARVQTELGGKKLLTKIDHKRAS